MALPTTHHLIWENTRGNMRLDDSREMVQTVWNEIPKHYPGIDTGEFVIMPNHFHRASVIVGAGPCACPKTSANGHPKMDNHRGVQKEGQPQGVAPTGDLQLNYWQRLMD